MKVKYIIIGILLLTLGLIVAACGKAPEPTTPPPPPPTAVPCPTAAPCPECPACPAPPEPVVKDVPFQEAWVNSGHADSTAEAFNHWNEDDPKVVPAGCAKCHSSTGIIDFATTGETVDVPVPGGVVACATCHNAAVAAMTEVTFPSGAVITGLGPEARCMTCHQGRESKVSVDSYLADKVGADADPDAVSADLGFRNIHYFAAGATLYGGEAHGGYEYDGLAYDHKFAHVEGIDTCLGCHDQHTLEVKVEVCQMCHEGVTTVEDLKESRMFGSLVDYDGDGDTTEGIFHELETIQENLYAGIMSYAKDVAGTGIVYDAHAYPYFFTDADGDGVIDQAEGANVRFATWTPRLLKAAFNYQYSMKDPGAFAHNGKYVIELMCDSIDDLNTKLATPVTACKHRVDAGHFAGSEEAFRHWDEDGAVSASCAKCHSATGLPQFLKEGVNTSNPISNGFLCSTCHDEANWPNRYALKDVTFPSGAVVTFGENADANLCIACHQGRESTVSVNRTIAGMKPDEVSDKIRFRNIHYFAAGATLFGTDAKGAYEYDGMTYVGQNTTHPLNKCIECHDTHALEIKIQACAGCHAGVTDPETIRFATDTTDWDGDGDVTESIHHEIAGLAEALYAEIQKYAEAHGGAITYNAHAYPYYFGADGKSYATWTPRLLKAAYNYQYFQKDPGTFAHNPKYILQVLFDSIKDLGGNVSGFTRP